MLVPEHSSKLFVLISGPFAPWGEKKENTTKTCPLGCFKCAWRKEVMITIWKSSGTDVTSILVSHSCFVTVPLQHCTTYQGWTDHCFSFIQSFCSGPHALSAQEAFCPRKAILFLLHLSCWQSTEWSKTLYEKEVFTLHDLIWGTVIVDYYVVLVESSMIFRSSNAVSSCVFQICLWIRTETPWVLHTADSESCQRIWITPGKVLQIW